MCGICGVFNYANGSIPADKPLLARMRDTLRHRGPDDAGCWISPDGRVGLGHARLSIVDLSPAGRQPMANEDDSVWIIYNGETYNHRELRHSLEEKGHRYRSHSDTETLLHLYEERDWRFPQELLGMWGLAIWDERKGRLLLARDRLGVKPVYYTVAGGRLIFGSEIKAILAHPAVTPDIDPAALLHYLTFINTPAPETLFKGIRKLPPATVLLCDSRGEITLHRYWDPLAVPLLSPDFADPRELAQRIRDLLADAVRLRMMSDVPIGAFLSGGIDSTANVALLSQLSSQPVNTFSVAFEGFGPDRNFHDMPYARQVAQQFKTNHRELVIGGKDFLDYVPKLVYHQDEPVADPACVPIHFISACAKQNGVTVVLTGEGSDEVWAGYPEYLAVARIHSGKWRALRALPRPLRALLYAAMRRYSDNRGRRDLFRRIARDEELFWGYEIGFWNEEREALLSREFRARLPGPDSAAVVNEYYAEIRARRPESDFLTQMIYLELRNRLPELLLMRVDKVTMASSLEARVPFLDHRLVELGMSVPAALKAPRGRPKRLLKQALRGLVPDNILDRPKQGFRVPFPEWFRAELGDRIGPHLLESPLRERGFFDYERIAALIAEHREHRRDNSHKLWSLINLTAWYDHWIAGIARTL